MRSDLDPQTIVEYRREEQRFVDTLLDMAEWKLNQQYGRSQERLIKKYGIKQNQSIAS